jgi:hypothetical protein
MAVLLAAYLTTVPPELNVGALAQRSKVAGALWR